MESEILWKFALLIQKKERIYERMITVKAEPPN